jgi:hypothetical protein
MGIVILFFGERAYKAREVEFSLRIFLSGHLSGRDHCYRGAPPCSRTPPGQENRSGQKMGDQIAEPPEPAGL